MLHNLAIHSCNREYIIIVGEYIIIIVAIYVHVPELKIIPSRTFIIKTWIQIAIRLLKQVQVIHKLMIRIAPTALPTMEKQIYGKLSFLPFSLEIGHDILTFFPVHYFLHPFFALKIVPLQYPHQFF